MKKLLLLTLSMTLCFAFLTSCAKQAEDNATTEATSPAPTEASTDENGFPLDYDRSGHIFPNSEANPIEDITLRIEFKESVTGDPRFDKRELPLSTVESVNDYVFKDSLKYLDSLIYGEEVVPTDEEKSEYRSVTAIYADGTEVTVGYDYAEKDGVYYDVKWCEGGNEDYRKSISSAYEIFEAEFDSLAAYGDAPELDWLTAISEDEGGTWKCVYNGEEYSEIYRMDHKVHNTNHQYSAPYPLVEIDPSEFPADGDDLAYVSGDGSVSAQMRISDSGEYICYNDANGEKWYQAKVLEGHKGSFVSAAFEAFRNNLGSIKRYKFGGAVDAEYAVESFANFDFGEYLTKELLGERDFTEYKLVSYEIEDSSETAVVFTIKYLCKPVLYDENTIAGGRLPGEGEYEGWYNCYQQYLLEYNSDDCYWYVTNQGTGGISLPK